VLTADLKTPSQAVARSSLHLSPKFVMYSLRSGEFPAKVRRVFPATSDISGKFRFHSEVRLVVLYTGTLFILRIHVRFIVFLSHLLFISGELHHA
jgi:hypothetical protein